MSLYPEWLNDEPIPMMEETEQPQSHEESYLFDFEKGVTKMQVSGKSIRSDAHQAYLFWVWKCLHTERFKYPIYSADFGVEIETIIERDYARPVTESEIKRTISESLKVNDHTIDVKEFEFFWSHDALEIVFVLSNTYDTDTINFRRGV